MFKMFFWGVLTGWAYHDEINAGLRKAEPKVRLFIKKVKDKAAEMKEQMKEES